MATKQQIEEWWSLNIVPTITQRIQTLINSFRHVEDAVPLADVEGLADALNGKVATVDLNAEATARAAADIVLQTNIDAKTTIAAVDAGFQPLDKSVYQMGNYYNKIYAQKSGVAQVKWLTWGDSYGQKIFLQIGDIIKNQCGGVVSGAFFAGSYTGITINTSSGTITDNASDFQYWVTGITSDFSATATRTYGIGGASFANATRITVLYALQAGGGNFKIQVNGVDAVGFTNIATAGVAGTLGIATITQAATNSTVTVIGLSGTVKIIGVGIENTTMSGLTIINVGQGGIPLGGGTASVTGYASALSNFNQFLAYINPDVFTHEMKEDSSYYATALSTFYGAIATSLTNTDVLLIGSPPVGGSNSDIDQVLQNTILRNFASTNGYKYYDTYRLFRSYAKLVQLGWQGDGTHVDVKCDFFRGKKMLDDIGITSIDITANSATNVLNAITQTSLLRVKQAGSIRNLYQVLPEPSFGLDLQIKSDARVITLYDASNNVIAQNVISGGGFYPVLQNNIQVGAGNARLNGSSGIISDLLPTTLGYANHISAGYIQPIGSNTSVASGNVNINFTTSAYQRLTLTGNIGQISFTAIGSSQKVILVIIQDATGSRTCSWTAAIRFSGGLVPRLSTTPLAADVFVFEADGSGGYFEVGRYIQDRVAVATSGSLIATSTKTAAYTATANDEFLMANATSAAFSITLPTAVGRSGQRYVIKKTDISANAVTVATTSSQTIDGSSTFSLAAQYKYVTLLSDGTNWMVTGNN